MERNVALAADPPLPEAAAVVDTSATHSRLAQLAQQAAAMAMPLFLTLNMATERGTPSPTDTWATTTRPWLG